MYWEEFWDAVMYSANSQVEERNANFRFHFMLNVDKKDQNKWEDLPIPFPAIDEKDKTIDSDLSGVEQLPPELQGLVYRPDG